MSSRSSTDLPLNSPPPLPAPRRKQSDAALDNFHFGVEQSAAKLPPPVVPRFNDAVLRRTALLPTQSSEQLSLALTTGDSFSSLPVSEDAEDVASVDYFDIEPIALPAPIQNVHTRPTVGLVDGRRPSGSFDGVEVVDFGEDNEEDRQKEVARQRAMKRKSHIVNFENVTVDDYHSLDVLLADLESVFKSTGLASHRGSSKTPAPTAVPPATGPKPVAAPPKKIIPASVPPSSSRDLTKTSQQSLERIADVEDETPVMNKFMSTSTRSLGFNSTQSSVEIQSIATSHRTTYNPPLDGDTSQEEKIQLAMQKLSLANIRKITTRVYIEHAKMFKTVVITSLMSAQLVTSTVRHKAKLQESDQWTLFELVNDCGIERPLRDFEIVTDVLASWEVETVNALLIKKYGYRESLTREGSETYSRMCGWMHLEVKRGKWQRLFFELKALGLYHSKDAKGTAETLLCPLSSYDVYTLMRSRQKAPTKFCFAVKAQQSIKNFTGLPNEYLQYLCVDSLEKMKDWVLSFRNAKSQRMLAMPQYQLPPAPQTPLATHSGHLAEHAKPKPADSTPSVLAFPPPPTFDRNHPRKQSVGKSTSLNELAGVRRNDPVPRGSNLRPQQSDNAEHTGEANVPATDFIQHRPAEVRAKPLLQVVDKQQRPDPNQPLLNLTQFGGGEHGKPLVPLTAHDLKNIPGVDVARYQLPPKPNMALLQKPQVKSCATCGCGDFARNPFKATSCANCFHIH